MLQLCKIVDIIVTSEISAFAIENFNTGFVMRFIN